MSEPTQFQLLVALAYELLLLITLLLIILRKKEPSGVLGWSLTVVFFPLIGLLAFYTFGITKIPRNLRRKIKHRDSFEQHRPESALTVPSPGPQWDAVARMLENLEEAPRRCGNRFELLGRGAAAFERMFEAIQKARHHVHVETYIFRSDGLGQQLLEILIERVRAGLEVRLIVDSVGTLRGGDILRLLRRAGGEAAAFMPILSKRFTPNLRNHRKIVVVDGELAFIGGLNVGEEYLGHIRRRDRGWADMHFELEGPAVWDVQAIFAEDWSFCTGQNLEDAAYYPDLPAAADGGSALQVIGGGPDRELNPVRQAFFATINGATKTLRVATPYVVPDTALRDALKTAALRGVRVQILTQGWPPDYVLVSLCSSYFFAELMAAGIEIHRYGAGMMHSKLLVADDEYAVVGSANLDNRSLLLNFELAAMLDTPADVAAVVQRFEEDLQEAEFVDPETWPDRPRWRRLAENAARLLAPLM